MKLANGATADEKKAQKKKAAQVRKEENRVKRLTAENERLQANLRELLHTVGEQIKAGVDAQTKHLHENNRIIRVQLDDAHRNIETLCSRLKEAQDDTSRLVAEGLLAKQLQAATNQLQRRTQENKDLVAAATSSETQIKTLQFLLHQAHEQQVAAEQQHRTALQEVKDKSANKIDLTQLSDEELEGFQRQVEQDYANVKARINKELADRKDKAANQCKICMEAANNTAFVPCGHHVACATCAEKLKVCPICRAAVTSVLKLFKS